MRHLADVLQGAAAGGIAIALLLWVAGHTDPHGWINLWLHRFALIVLIITAVSVIPPLAAGVATLSQAAKTRREEFVRKDQELENGYREFRERLRCFTIRIVDSYRFITDLSLPEQRRWALQHFDQVTNTWPSDATEYRNLRAHDLYPRALQDLGGMAQNLARIWQAWTWLYEYAAGFSTAPERAREWARNEREIRRIKITEARAAHEFQMRVEQGRVPEDPPCCPLLDHTGEEPWT